MNLVAEKQDRIHRRCLFCLLSTWHSASNQRVSSALHSLHQPATQHAARPHQRCADCGRVRLRTQIRSTSWIRGLTADGFFTGRCGRGLTRITSHSFSAPRWILWASLMKLVLRGAFRGGQCLITVAYNCLDTDTRTPTCRAMQGAGGEWYGHGN